MKKHMKMLRLGVIIQQKRSKLQFTSLNFKLACQVLAGSLIFLMQLQRVAVWMGLFLFSPSFPCGWRLGSKITVTKFMSLSSEAFLWEPVTPCIQWNSSSCRALLAWKYAGQSDPPLAQKGCSAVAEKWHLLTCQNAQKTNRGTVLVKGTTNILDHRWLESWKEPRLWANACSWYALHYSQPAPFYRAFHYICFHKVCYKSNEFSSLRFICCLGFLSGLRGETWS